MGSFNESGKSNNTYYDASSFVAFADKNGKLIWSRLFGDGSFQEILSVKISSKGNLYAVGQHQFDSFLHGLDSNGNSILREILGEVADQ